MDKDKIPIDKFTAASMKVFKENLPYIQKTQEEMNKAFASSHVRSMVEQVHIFMNSVDFKALERIKASFIIPKPAYEKIIPLLPAGVYIEKAKRERDNKMIELLEQIAHNTTAVQYTRLTADEIDTFYNVSKVKEVDIAGNVPLDLEEKEVKTRLHEIIGDPFIRKDWGGEKCDIFTLHIRFRNKKVPAAFVLKGKSYSRGKLALSDLGKNADQLCRLFEVPAEIYFIQSNGAIDSAVESTVQAFMAKKINDGVKAYYCIIDGVDTARILSAYNKL